ncbi:hypothetical protein OH76DRAFT_1403778 [Lentinus brumalis]|uniref:Uncharacterized protein n=1 Tax=Lentinus brumalis TaxID=2498619 RepID=A0A371D9K4_9APHY|nr:hypothetical protein OH76DRAFT_1403778 [Polyporus brumalis]
MPKKRADRIKLIVTTEPVSERSVEINKVLTTLDQCYKAITGGKIRKDIGSAIDSVRTRLRQILQVEDNAGDAAQNAPPDQHQDAPQDAHAAAQARYRIPTWVWNEMRDMLPPRYESTVDAIMSVLLQCRFPEEGTFQNAPHHKVRYEVPSTASQGELESSFFLAYIVGRMAQQHEEANPGDHSMSGVVDKLQQTLFAAEVQFDDSRPSLDTDALQLNKEYDLSDFDASFSDPPFQSTPRSTAPVPGPSGWTASDDSEADIFFDPQLIENAFAPRQERKQPSPDHLSTPSTSSPTASRGGPSLNVSGFTHGSKLDLGGNSLDSMDRIVPPRGSGHARHGIPDFLVLQKHSHEVILVVENKLSDNPFEQLRKYSELFPPAADIWYLGCRVARPEGGLQFMLAFIDRSLPKAQLRVFVAPGVDETAAAGGKGPGAWYPWNSAHIHEQLRDLADRHWRNAEYPDEDPLVY